MSKGGKTINVCVVDLLGDELVYVCSECSSVLGEGGFVVGLIDGKRRFLIEHNPSLKCCGKEWHVPLLYKVEAAADKKRHEIIAIVKSDDDLSSLILNDVTDTYLEATIN